MCAKRNDTKAKYIKAISDLSFSLPEQAMSRVSKNGSAKKYYRLEQQTQGLFMENGDRAVAGQNTRNLFRIP